MASTQSQRIAGHRGIRRVWLNGRWVFRLQLQRGKLRRSWTFEKLEAAIAKKNEITMGGLPVTDTPPAEVPPQTVDDGFRDRVLDLERRGKDAGVTERVRVALRGSPTLLGVLPLADVLIDHVAEYRDQRLRLKLKNNTVVRELREWRAMLKQERPDLKIPAELFPAENLTRIRVLTPEQQAEVFPELAARHGERFALLSRLALLGVLRQNDVRTLQRDHVHLPERLLLLPRTKGGAPRAVHLNTAACTVLERALMLLPPEHQYVFGHPPTGQPYSRVHVSRCWRNAARACGLPGFTFHDLRHHGPTVAVNAGVSNPVLQALGGWKSARMVERYASVLAPAVRAAAELIGGSLPEDAAPERPGPAAGGRG